MNTRFIFLLVPGIIALSACSKVSYEKDAAYAELAFFNASYTLDAFLPANPGSNERVFLPVTNAGKQSALLTGKMPYFTPDERGARQDFPAINPQNTIPWSVFDHCMPGNYNMDIRLHTPDAASSFTFPIAIQQQQRYTCLLSDSLGNYAATLLLQESATPVAGVRLRLVQLCPDADSVNVRVGNNLVNGLRNMRYGSTSSYINYPLAADSVLKIRIFNARDTSAVIARNDLAASPGQSYLLILKYYRNPHQYVTSTGKTVNIIPNAQLDIRKTK